MHLFRVFAVSVFIPLISVGLCATGDSTGKVKGKLNRVKITEVVPRKLEDANSTLVHFPTHIGGNATNISDIELEPRKKSGVLSKKLEMTDSLPIHPHPLRLEIKSIQNSTRVDEFDHLLDLFEGEGRSLPWEHIEHLGWLFDILWKAVTSYVIVAVLNLLLAPLLKKFGWGGPSWETYISLGNDGKNPLNLFPSLTNFHYSFGGEGKKDDYKGDGWGQQYGHGGGAPIGAIGLHPGHAGGGHGHGGGISNAGWLSYDQYALALPYVDKYSQKAAKKSSKYYKKAKKYAEKASKYAAKAQAYRLQVKPVYANSFIQPGAGAHQPGIPGYGGGWGRR